MASKIVFPVLRTHKRRKTAVSIVFFFVPKEIEPAVRSNFVISQMVLTSSTLMEREE